MKGLMQEKKEGLICLSILLAVVIVVLFSLFDPVWQQAGRYRAELRKDVRVLQELRAVEAVQDEIRSVQQKYRDENLGGWVYSGRNRDEISLDIQRRVSAWLEGFKVHRITPFVTGLERGYSAVGVEVQFTAPLVDVMKTLEQIESSRPLLMIEHIRIAPIQARAWDKDGQQPPQHVSVQMHVQSYVAAEGES